LGMTGEKLSDMKKIIENCEEMEKNNRYQKVIVLSMALMLLVGLLVYITPARIAWFDESFSIIHASNPILYLLQPLDVHPPVYYIIIHILSFGSLHPVWYYRIISLLFGVASIPFLAGIFKRIYKPGRVSLEWAFTIFMIMFIGFNTPLHYFTEVRMYGIGIFFAIASFYYLMRMIETSFFRGKTGYVIFTILLLWTHYFTYIYLLMELIYVLILLPSNGKEYMKLIINKGKWVLIVMGISILCQTMYLYVQKARIFGTWFKWSTWTSLPSTYFYYFTHTFGAAIPTIGSIWGIIFLVFIIGVIIYGMMLVRGDEGKKALFLGIMISLPPVVGMIINLYIMKAYHHRFFLFAIWGVYMLITISIIRIWEKRAIAGWIVGIIIVISMFAMLNAYINGVQASDPELKAALKIMDTKCGEDAYVIHETLFSGAISIYNNRLNNCKLKDRVYTFFPETAQNSGGFDMFNRSEYIFTEDLPTQFPEYYYYKSSENLSNNADCINLYTGDGLWLDRCVYNSSKVVIGELGVDKWEGRAK